VRRELCAYMPPSSTRFTVGQYPSLPSFTRFTVGQRGTLRTSPVSLLGKKERWEESLLPPRCVPTVEREPPASQCVTASCWEENLQPPNV